MMQLKLTDTALQRFKDKGLDQKTLLLVTDDGGGKYSLQGGACSIGAKFTIVVLDQPDQLYPIELKNNANLKLYTSDYDLYFFSEGLTLDFKQYQFSLKDNSGILDGAVQIANGQDILAAFEQGITAAGKSC